MDDKESLAERRDNELEALQAIYMDDFQDIREKPDDLPKVVLKLTPLQSMLEKGVHAKVELVIQYTTNYPNQSPILSLQNAVGLSNEDIQDLNTKLECEAAELVGEVMAHHLAHLVQTFLHSHNKPRLSFYDEMMTNKKKEEERAKAKQLQKLLEQQEADKLISEEEKRQIEEELLRREEMMKESRKKRSSLLNNRDKDEVLSQSIKTRDAETMSPSKDKDTSFSQKRTASQSGKFETPASSMSSWRRRRNSSESSEIRSYSGSRTVAFVNKGEHVVHLGKCIGQESSGCSVFSGLDTTTGDLVTMREWKLICPTAPPSKPAVKSLHWADSAGSQDTADKLMKQVTRIEQEITSLMARISHHHLVHFLAVKVSSLQPNVAVQILEEYVGGGNLELQLRPGGIPVESIRNYTYQILDALWYLHGKSVVHKNLKLSNCHLDASGDIKLTNYSVEKGMAELYQEFGADKSGTSSNVSARSGKKGDIYDMGLLVLSLLKGETVTASEAEIPDTAPSDLRDFLSKCLCTSDKERLSAYQLLHHPFVLPCSYSNGASESSDKVAMTTGLTNSSSDMGEPLAPIPEFTFFSGVPGKSRIKSEFEQLEFLGKGGFGNVIKVRNKLDGGLYAIKRIPWNPQNTNLNRKITREVQLISRLNHENVVRYYNSWLEVAEENDIPSESEESLSDQVNKKPVVEAQKSEDSLMNLNQFEAPSEVPTDGKADDSWCSDGGENRISESDSSEDEAPFMAKKGSPKGSFFSSKSGGSSEGIVFATNSIEESMLQFGDLLDTESEDSDEGQGWQAGASTENNEQTSLQYLYIQMEYCEMKTLRYLIDEGLYKERDKVWRLLREIVEGLAHIHSQGIIHRDLKPVNLFLDANGHIKIGDFGLATTHGITRGEPAADVHAHTDNTTATPDTKEASTTAEGMTGKVGTTFYVAPELAKGSGRIKYSDKVDLYSLGIIFFEMCYRPLETGMERAKTLADIRTSKIKFPEDFDKKRLAKETNILTWLLQHDPEYRPSSQELLQSHYIPPKLEDHQLDEVLKHTLASSNSTRYRRLMTALFSQQVNPVFDVTYDIEILKAANSARAVLAQELVHETLKNIFKRHGALRIRTPLLMPRTKAVDKLESALTVVDHSGGVVILPYDLRVPFARYIARGGLTHVKRFDIGCVYRDRKILGAHPKELYECAFDIVSPTSEGNVPDAEVVLSVAEIVREFPCLDERNYFIHMNHAGLLKAVLTSYGVPEERHQDLFKILQAAQTERLRNEQLNEFLEGVQVPERSIAALYGFLYFEGPVDKVREHIIGVLKRRTQSSSDARQALQELQSVVAHCATFDIKLSIVIKTTLVYNIQHFSGIIFQVVATDNRKLKRGRVDILAAGGRYDKLVSHFRHGSEAHQCPGAVGVSIAVEKIVSAVSSEDDVNLPCACDVLVCSASQTSMLNERMRIVRELWGAGISATLMYNSPAQFTLEDIQDYCKEAEIPHLVFLKEFDPGVVKVVSMERDKVTKTLVSTKDLLEHLQAKINSRTEASDSVVSGTKPNINQSTIDHSTSSSPDIHVSFTTQDKLQWNIKKRYESQMMAKIGPVVHQIRQHISSKSGVEVIGVDLPGNVLKSMAVSLELEGNEDTFDSSVSSVTDKHSRYAKAISRVCDELRELKVVKKLPIIFVYSVKDEIYRIFF